jgi:hypothetical protein
MQLTTSGLRKASEIRGSDLSKILTLSELRAFLRVVVSLVLSYMYFQVSYRSAFPCPSAETSHLGGCAYAIERLLLLTVSTTCPHLHLDFLRPHLTAPLSHCAPKGAKCVSASGYVSAPLEAAVTCIKLRLS